MVSRGAFLLVLGAVAIAAAVVAAPQVPAPAPTAQAPAAPKPAAPAPAAQPATGPYVYVVRHDRWTEEDERDWHDFIKAIGGSDCATLNACLRSSANPFRASDPPDYVFRADCADLPYVLRFYFAWKRGLPFSYVSETAPAAGGGDIRYTRSGNIVAVRTDVPGGVMTGMEIIGQIRANVNSGNYRMHPDRDGPLSDFYSPKIDPKAILPGTAIYDPAGHLAIVYDVDADGRIHFFDAHTDYTLTQMVFDLRFARSRPAHGAGFKNWRPLKLVGAVRQKDGTLKGGHIEFTANKAIPDFSDEQYYGNGKRPDDNQWESSVFLLGKESIDYYDYVRAKMAGGQMLFDPVKEINDMARSLCSDLHYRAVAVDLAIQAGIQKQQQPDRLPSNIYGTSGDWETFSTPSRDARLKTAFKALRDTAQRFIEMHARGDTKHLQYAGSDLAGDMLSAYGRAIRYCSIAYTNSAGRKVTLPFETARQRLFAMSFDPYHCIEHRWGAAGAEAASCPDGQTKRDWYAAEQGLRNQIERTYDARMDFSLEQLRKPGPGKGVATPPDTDIVGYLQRVKAGKK